MMFLPEATERPCDTFVKGSNLDELSTFLSSSALSVTAKHLNNGEVSYECGIAKAGSLCVGLYRNEVEILVECDRSSDKVYIFLLNYGRSTINMGGRHAVCTAEQGFIFDGERHNNTLLVGPGEHLVVGIDRAALANSLMHMLERPVSASFDFSAEIDLTSGPGMAMARIAAALQASLSESALLRRAPAALASLSDAFIHMVLETLPHRFSSELYRRASPVPWYVKRAVEFMHANLSLPLTVEEIAAACDVSSRTIQVGFQRFKMTTPTAYLQHLRLEGVHQELMHARRGQTVGDIAPKWGFGHLGRFAGEYRAYFGCFPSQTLRFSLTSASSGNLDEYG